MLNTTVLNKTNSVTNVDNKDGRISISRTKPETFFISTKINSEKFRKLMVPEPYLMEEFCLETGEPHYSYLDHRWVKDAYKCYTDGVSIVQIQTNGEYAFIELEKRECEPLKVLSHSFPCDEPKEEE